MSFGKRGRPPHDVAQERLRIYAAVLPVIRQHGLRTHMRAIAEAAHMSVGGIYHYFDSKRQIVLYGLDPEALRLACATFQRAVLEQAPNGAEAVASAYIEKSIYMFRLIQPAANAALELGLDEIRSVLDKALRQDVDGLTDVLATVSPELGEESQSDLANAVRRTLLSLSFDPNGTEEDVRRQLNALLQGYIAAEITTR